MVAQPNFPRENLKYSMKKGIEWWPQPRCLKSNLPEEIRINCHKEKMTCSVLNLWAKSTRGKLVQIKSYLYHWKVVKM